LNVRAVEIKGIPSRVMRDFRNPLVPRVLKLREEKNPAIKNELLQKCPEEAMKE
jgi:hypothetical protein